MKILLLKISILIISLTTLSFNKSSEFQGKAYYISKTKMNLGNWGSRLSEAQKKQVESRLKNRLEKTYILSFDKEVSIFKEEDKLDAISGATDSWGKNFAPGEQYKNIKINSLIQAQEFYGKRFLVKDKLQPISWIMAKETKQIGNYTCFKATASILADDLTWYDFSWDKLRNNNEENLEKKDSDLDLNENEMIEVEAWYTPQIPVGHGPLEYSGLPGLILEVSAGNTTMLCSKIIMNPEEKSNLEPPNKGQEVTKKEYQEIIASKMKEFRDNRSARR
jgi:GLPGLI family protein